jgi:uncharacterized protein DUF5681
VTNKTSNGKGSKRARSTTAQSGSGDYEVGYRKPPAHTRFKRGVSGNPSGKQRGSKNIATLLEREFSQRIPVRENGIERMITKREAAVKQFVNGLVSGNVRYAKFLMAFLEKLAAASDSVVSVAAGVAADEVIDPEAAQKLQELWDQLEGAQGKQERSKRGDKGG